MIKNIKNNIGNSIVTVFGLVSFLFLATIGMGNLILNSFSSNLSIESSNKAFYASEGALEVALFEEVQHLSGHQAGRTDRQNHTAGDHFFVNFENVNHTRASWQTVSRGSSQNPGAGNIVYVPPQITASNSRNNWKMVNFGETVSFDLFVDDSEANPANRETEDADKIIQSPDMNNVFDVEKLKWGFANGITKAAGNILQNVNIEILIPTPNNTSTIDNPDQVLLSWNIKADNYSFFSKMCNSLENGNFLVSDTGIHNNDLEGIVYKKTNPCGMISDSNTEKTITAFLNEEAAEFPKIIFQLGKAPTLNGETATVPFAFVRVSFQYDNATSINNFPLPDDTTLIRAFGNAGSFEYESNATISPKKILPIFDFTIFQF